MENKTMNQLADELKQLIDDYWRLDISEKNLCEQVSTIFSDTCNRGLIMRGPRFKAGFERKLGKKRIEEMKKILIKLDGELYKGLSE